MDTTAKIKTIAQLEKKSGVTEQLARRMFDNLGSVHLAVVELRSAERIERPGDEEQVIALEILNLEPAGDNTEINDHLRALMRALYRTREPQQLTIDSTMDDVEPTAREVLQHGQALLADQDEEIEADD